VGTGEGETGRAEPNKGVVVRLLALVLVIFSQLANADCSCECINGRVQAVCSSTLDLKPICSPRICPILTPGIRPLPSLRVPPIGTTSCRKEQVWNGYRYVWREYCR